MRKLAGCEVSILGKKKREAPVMRSEERSPMNQAVKRKVEGSKEEME